MIDSSSSYENIVVQEDGNSNLKIASWNIAMGLAGPRRAEFIMRFKKSKADIILVQDSGVATGTHISALFRDLKNLKSGYRVLDKGSWIKGPHYNAKQKSEMIAESKKKKQDLRADQFGLQIWYKPGRVKLQVVNSGKMETRFQRVRVLKPFRFDVVNILSLIHI